MQAPHGFDDGKQRAGASTLEYGYSIIQARMPAGSKVMPSFIEGTQKLTLWVQPPAGYEFHVRDFHALLGLGGLSSTERITDTVCSLRRLLPPSFVWKTGQFRKKQEVMDGRRLERHMRSCCFLYRLGYSAFLA